MSDAKLRELERRWQETGDVADEAALLAARARAGDLELDRLRLAAYLGHPGASAVDPKLVRPSGKKGRSRGLLDWARGVPLADQPPGRPTAPTALGREASLRVAAAAARATLELWAEHGSREFVAEAVDLAEELARERMTELHGEAQRVLRAIGGLRFGTEDPALDASLVAIMTALSLVVSEEGEDLGWDLREVIEKAVQAVGATAAQAEVRDHVGTWALHGHGIEMKRKGVDSS